MLVLTLYGCARLRRLFREATGIGEDRLDKDSSRTSKAKNDERVANLIKVTDLPLVPSPVCLDLHATIVNLLALEPCLIVVKIF